MYIEGKNAIRQAIESKTTINKVMVDKNYQGRKDEIINLAAQNKIKFEFVPRIVLDKKSKTGHHQGYIAEAVDYEYSCECAGVHGIIIHKNRACQVNETVIRTSTGAITNMLIAKVTNLKDAIDELKAHDIWVYAAEADGEPIYDKNLKQNIAIVIGSEGFGTRKSILERCDGVLSLPLNGQVNSLNASVACGIVVFEVVRQRLQ